MATRIILMCVLFLKVTNCEEPFRAQKYGLIDQLSNGMKIAKDFLGSESVALKVADFVVRAFNPKSSNPGPSAPKPPPYHPNEAYQETEDQESSEESRPNFNVNEDVNPMAPLRQLVKLFGLQPPQISAVAVNALLFVAQMISSFLSGPHRPHRPSRTSDPLAFIFNKPSSKLQDLLASAKNESLPDVIEDLIEEQGADEDISCVKLLICKITPFVSKMQNAVFGEENVDAHKVAGAAAMYRHLPTNEEIRERGDICELKYKECDLN